MTVGVSESYPVRYDVEYPESLSRWLIFVKWLLVIPHLIIIYFLNIAYQVVSVIAFFAILITTKYPEGLFTFAVGIRRWLANAYAYTFLLRDEYPPFSLDPGQYPLVLDVEYPERLNRWMPLVKWLLAIPHYIVLAFLGVAALIVVIIAWFAILITGAFPRGMFDFVVGVFRWSERVNAYVLFMRDEYPPFSLKP